MDRETQDYLCEWAENTTNAIEHWGNGLSTWLEVQFHGVHKHLNRLEGTDMTTQQEVDALTSGFSDLSTKVGDLTATVVTDDSALAAEIENLKSQGVDVTGLQAVQTDLASKVTDLGTAVDATTALVPAPTTGTPTTGAPADGSTAVDTGTTAEATGSTEVDPTDPNQPGTTTADTSASATDGPSTDTTSTDTTSADGATASTDTPTA